MEKRVLVVDDEKLIVKGIKFSLEQEGLVVDCAYDGEEAVAAARTVSYDVILLDLMLPKLSGFEVCQQIREFSDVPIVMLTAKSEDIDKIMGLEYGADDYITKPFAINEVLARVRAVLRRSQASVQWAYNISKSIYEPDINFKTMRIDRNAKVCYIAGKPVNLTRTEFDILLFFLTHRNRVHAREEIIRRVWGCDVVVTNRTIDTNITRLRKKLGEYGNYIITRLGFGYGFKEAADQL